jgi:hypothetical protein
LKEDLRFRRSDYLPHHASILRGFISRRIHSAMTLSKAQLARTKWVTVLLEHCETVRLPAIYVQALATYFLPREWDAFTRVCELMGVALPRGDAQTRLIAQPFARELFAISGMFLVAKHDERTRHARNCFVVEAIFEKEYRERHEIPF